MIYATPTADCWLAAGGWGLAAWNAGLIV